MDGALVGAIRFIFGRACTGREVVTMASLSFSLLLRTLGSVWVSKHWGRIVQVFRCLLRTHCAGVYVVTGDALSIS